VVECSSTWLDSRHQALERFFAVRHLERFPAGTAYLKIIERLIEMFHLPPLRRTDLVFDLTAVGGPVAALFRYAEIEGTSRCVTIVPNEAVNKMNTFPYQISKKHLVGLMQLVLQTGRIKIAPGLEHADTLLDELANFRIRPGATIPDPLNDWRIGPQDDLLLAMAIAVWEAERRPYFPPEPRRRIARGLVFPEKW
jgi:hypothetical protein